MTFRSSLPVLFSLVAIITASVGGCGVNADQCSTPADCVGIYDDLPDRLQCVQGVCSRRGPTFANDAGATERSCNATVDCVAEGTDAFCRDRRCIDIRQNGVTEVTSNYGLGDPLFIGTIMTESITFTDGVIDSPYDKTNMDAIRMAADDWKAAAGSGGITLGAVNRPIVSVRCNGGGLIDKLHSCFDQMTNVLRAPVVIVRGDNEARLLLPKAIERDVVLYCTDCESQNFTPSETQGRLRFGFGSVSATFPMRVLWLKNVEQQIRQERGKAQAQPVKGVVVSSTVQEKMSTLLLSMLELNGVSLEANRTANNVVLHKVDVSSPDDYRAIAKAAVDLPADFVLIDNLGRDFHNQLMPEIEANWKPGYPRPRYIAGGAEQYPHRFERSVGANDDLRRRVTGVGFNVDDAEIDVNYNEYLDRFRSKVGYDPNGISTGFESYYVASYALVAAMYLKTTNPNDVRGTDFLNGLRQLTASDGAQTVDLRALQILPGVAAVKEGRRIDLRGLNSQLEWDPSTGSVPMNASVYCIKRTSRRFSIEELWVYDAFKGPVGAPELDTCEL